MKRYSVLLALMLVLIILLVSACSNPETPTSPAATTAPTSTQPPISKVDNLRLVGTIGPMAIPLAYMAEKNVLSPVANKTTFSVWATPTQLQAIIAGGQGDFVALPSNSSATFYNKGVQLQYLDNSIWNILYLITSDPNVKSVKDLKGKTVSVPYQGAVPDAMFQSLCKQSGLDATKDLVTFYTPDPVQASQRLLTGQDAYVLLSEPSATSVIEKGQASGITYYRAFSMAAEWNKTSASKTNTPIAGTVVLGAMKNRPEIVKVFVTEYVKAVQWMLANPVEAGQVGARALTDQGFTAPILTESLQNIDWRHQYSADARTDLEAFFTTLSLVSPNFIGGKLPDDGFYYKP
jgi:NitT/TauT family transport system substrate-binding protein